MEEHSVGSGMVLVANRLAQLQQQLGERGDTLSFSERNGLVDIGYYGLWCVDHLLPLYQTLCLPEVADRVALLSFRSPDVGANGAKEWDFTALLQGEVVFPELLTLFIEVQEPNCVVPYLPGPQTGGEDGQLAKWLDCAPNLQSLTAPSAPDARFFQRTRHPLRSLRLDAGPTANDFILNLSRSSCFAFLTELEWSDDWHLTTPFGHYQALFRSEACPPHVTIRDPHVDPERRYLTKAQLKELEALLKERHPSGSLKVVRFWGHTWERHADQIEHRLESEAERARQRFRP